MHNFDYSINDIVCATIFLENRYKMVVKNGNETEADNLEIGFMIKLLSDNVWNTVVVPCFNKVDELIDSLARVNKDKEKNIWCKFV